MRFRKQIVELLQRRDLWGLLNKAAELHGHICVGLALGVKTSAVALERLGVLPADDTDIIAVTDNNTCFADGVQVVMGATLGNNRLIYRDAGRFALILVDRRGGKAVRISLAGRLTTPTMENPRYRDYWSRLPQLTEEKRQEFRSLMEKASAEVLEAPDAIFKIEEVPPDPILDALKSTTRPSWTVCERCGVATLAERAVVVGGRHYCPDCAGLKTYAVVGRKITEFKPPSSSPTQTAF
ncbi:formylmethanofuran dehydrogenase, subunit E [Pyrobaculum islandicum DSM 4184]|uniref:Formylmethanofuran dehydrogenase, subunit E n=1 Tax=Pyrobaculum islandicum (strain DSM 4184 / JCM 9189 / GEO3) TaxID=384616 RepID=A1RR19_PYRIL|nr:FmdE family protein [Pyrobaculum islandicum]ABL87401.1 formylmethanofuran dehydrogenase, subunit E [Pyrobaculum islandicum DSM 4184]